MVDPASASLADLGISNSLVPTIPRSRIQSGDSLQISSKSQSGAKREPKDILMISSKKGKLREDL